MRRLKSDDTATDMHVYTTDIPKRREPVSQKELHTTRSRLIRLITCSSESNKRILSNSHAILFVLHLKLDDKLNYNSTID